MIVCLPFACVFFELGQCFLFSDRVSRILTQLNTQSSANRAYRKFGGQLYGFISHVSTQGHTRFKVSPVLIYREHFERKLQ